MSIGINVQGGTHAGWKIQKQPEPWTHACPPRIGQFAADGSRHGGVTLTSYSCPDCGARRP